MIKLGIFIIPDKNLKKEILFQKKKIKLHLGSQKYLSHLPHCTVCVLNVRNSFIKNMKRLKIKKIKFKNELKIKKKDIFFNDPITNGNTLVYKVEKNKFLKNLQLNIIKLLENYIVYKKINFKTKTMNKNYKKFGYPFVSTLWKPHFTVASLLKLKKNYKILREFKNENRYNFCQKIKKINLYQIIGNKHRYLWTIKIS